MQASEPDFQCYEELDLELDLDVIDRSLRDSPIEGLCDDEFNSFQLLPPSAVPTRRSSSQPDPARTISIHPRKRRLSFSLNDRQVRPRSTTPAVDLPVVILQGSTVLKPAKLYQHMCLHHCHSVHLWMPCESPTDFKKSGSMYREEQDVFVFSE